MEINKELIAASSTPIVLAILAESGMKPSRLELEITENTLLDGSGTSGRVLKKLRDAGVRVALEVVGQLTVRSVAGAPLSGSRWRKTAAAPARCLGR